MRVPAAAKWVGLALLGLVIAVAVAIAASNLVSRQIGIADEPLRAGESLAPAVAPAGEEGGKGERAPGTTTDETAPRAEAPPATTVPPETETEAEATEPTTPDGHGDDSGGGGGDGGGDSDDD